MTFSKTTQREMSCDAFEMLIERLTGVEAALDKADALAKWEYRRASPCDLSVASRASW